MKDTLIEVLKQKIEAYKSTPYLTLLQKTNESEPVFFENGNFESPEFFQGEIVFAIDDKKTGNIRIIGEISDGKNIKLNHDVIIDRDGYVISEWLS
jgi:hypothetical protein